MTRVQHPSSGLVWQARLALTPPTSGFHRASALGELADRTFDLVVIGGGITGAGVALDAAARGLRTALVERGDFACGTSSRSSQLVHGGLRYLRRGELGLVGESLAERQRLLRNAPHLVSPLAFLIPLLAKGGGPGGGVVDRAGAGAHAGALWLYDLCGGARIGHLHRRVTSGDVLAHLPTLRPDRLTGGFVYHDARVDDARLTLAVVATAVLDHGAVAANYAPVTTLVKEASGRVAGARVAPRRMVAGGGNDPGVPEEIEVRASVVVNAAGVWTDEVQALDEDHHRPVIRSARGAHLSVPRQVLPCDMAAVLPVPGERRTIFVVPWGDHVYLGTTDTDHRGPLGEPGCTSEDVSYLLDAVNAVVTKPVSRDDVTGLWAGLRPLLAGPAAGPGGPDRRGGALAPQRTADLSRRHRVAVSPGGLVSVTGGKLTTYRKMAAETVDAVVAQLARTGRGPTRHRRPIRHGSPTRHLRLRGAAGTEELREEGAASRLGTAPEVLDHLVSRYGGQARAVLAMAQAQPHLALPLVPGQPYLRAEAVYAVRYEMAQTVDDVLSRRTRAALHDDRGAAAAAGQAADLMAGELGWSAADRDRQVAAFTDQVLARRGSAGLSGTTAAGPGGRTVPDLPAPGRHP